MFLNMNYPLWIIIIKIIKLYFINDFFLSQYKDAFPYKIKNKNIYIINIKNEKKSF